MNRMRKNRFYVVRKKRYDYTTSTTACKSQYLTSVFIFYRSTCAKLAHDVQPIPDAFHLFILRLFFKSSGTSYNGKQETFSNEENSDILQRFSDAI